MARETPGQAASTTVLADIEATVDGLCACGCGIRLGPNSDSAWFASDECQARWNAHNAGIDNDNLSRLLARVRTLQQRPIVRAAGEANRVDLRIHTTADWLNLGDNRALIIAWVEANGIDHQTVPATNTIEVAGDELRLDVWQDGELRRERRTVSHRVPLDVTLLTDEAPPPRVTWVPQVADPAYPTAAELAAGSDLTDYVVPGSLTFHEPDNSGCLFPPASRRAANPLLLQRVDLRGENLIPVPGAPGTYRLIFNAVPLADIAVPPRPLSQPWWRRALNYLTGKA